MMLRKIEKSRSNKRGGNIYIHVLNWYVMISTKIYRLFGYT